MAYLGNTFDPSAVEPAQDFAPVPAGEYLAIIIDSELKPTRNGAGEYLALTHQIIDGEFKGRMIWANLNIVNHNEVAQRIAQQQLSAICHAVGQTQAITDSEQLHNRPMVIRVEFVPANDEKGWRAKNEIKAWKAPATAQAPAPAAPRPAAPAAPARPAPAPPWAAQGAR